jgi:TPR repeat protein
MYAAAPAGLAEFAEPATLAKFAAPVTLAELVAPAALANFADPDIRQDVDLLTSRLQQVFTSRDCLLSQGVGAFRDGFMSIYLQNLPQRSKSFDGMMYRGLIAMANGKVVPTTFFLENLGWKACFINGSLIIDARMLLNPDCVRDNPEALNLLALLFMSNIFLSSDRDNASASKIFLRAAKQGSICALHNYGRCLADGVGVEQNREEAVKIYRTIVENERALARFRGVFAQAQYRYGFCLSYLNIAGVAEREEAATCYKLCADKGNALAQHRYGSCLENGR